MCGIWGFCGNSIEYSDKEIKKVINELFLLSESRGKEAAGIAYVDVQRTHVLKRNLPASSLIKTNEYCKFVTDSKASNIEYFNFMGHSRLVTNGNECNEKNNQPVVTDNVATVHNGIIVNVEDLWKKYSMLQQESDVDTEVFVKLLDAKIKKGETTIESIANIYYEIFGMASTISLLSDRQELIAASNNGSLYYVMNRTKTAIILASEKLILSTLFHKCSFLNKTFDEEEINQINAGNGLIYINGKKGIESFSFTDCKPIEKVKETKHNVQMRTKSWSRFEVNRDPINKLKRCTCCLLPSTMPFIQFDNQGVCNYCRTYKKQQYLGEEKLQEWVGEQKKRETGSYDSLVSFSGGRDSSYGLHYFVKELGMKPIAYSYDWGMVTDLARRNQSRMCAELGVELILVSADIRKKRENIRKNVSAWLKKPDLGMVPLFMAGDKQYFYYANKVCKQCGIDNILLASNPFEKTHFKSGFCGVIPSILSNGDTDMQLEQLESGGVARMAMHYLKQYLFNPSYINSSIWDTAGATISYYMIPHNYFRLFDYIPWNEEEVNDVLLGEYDWEIAPDTKSTWRIGDGTAPFYNYIYYLVCGFSENDTLRSNQIREGMITREEGMKYIQRDNVERFDSMEWYFDTIGVDMEEALKVIQRIPKLYII